MRYLLPLLASTVACLAQFDDFTTLATVRRASATPAESYATLFYSSIGTSLANFNIGQGYIYGSHQFTAPSNGTIGRVEVVLKNTSSSDGNVSAGIFTDSGTNSPQTQVGDWSDEIPIASFTTSYTTNSFTNLTASVTGSAVYHVVLKDSKNENPNFWSWSIVSATGSNLRKSTDGASWVTQNDGYSCWVRLYISP